MLLKSLLEEVCESEARYASTLRNFAVVADECTFPGWAPGWHADTAFSGGQDSMFWPRVWCVRNTVELIAAVSEAFACSVARALEKISANIGDHVQFAIQLSRVRISFQRFVKTLFLYEQFAGMYAVLKQSLDVLSANPEFAENWFQLSGQVNLKNQEWHGHKYNLLSSSILTVTAASQSAVPSSLNGCLILPVQRVPRHELLLAQLVDCLEKLSKEDKVNESSNAWDTELVAFRTILEQVRAVAEKMELAVLNSSDCATAFSLAAFPSVPLRSEKSQPQGPGNNILSHLCFSETRFVSCLAQLEEHFAKPLLSCCFQGTRFEQAPTSAPERKRNSFRRRTSLRLKSFASDRSSEHSDEIEGEPLPVWLSKLPDEQVKDLGNAVMYSGLVVLCQSIVQLRALSECLLSEIHELSTRGSPLQGEHLGDFSVWLASTSRFHYVVAESFLTCFPWWFTDSLPCHAHPIKELSVLLNIDYVVPESFFPFAKTSVCARRLGNKTIAMWMRKIVQKTVANQDADRQESLDFFRMMHVALLRPSQYMAELDFITLQSTYLGRPMDETGYALAAEVVGDSRKFIQVKLAKRLLGSARKLLSSVASLEQDSDDHQSYLPLSMLNLVRCGGMYFNEKPCIVWLFPGRMILGLLKNPKSKFTFVSLKSILPQNAGSVLSEALSSKIILDPDNELVLRVPSNDDALCWTLPPPESLSNAKNDNFGQAYFAAWAHDMHLWARVTSKA